MTAVELGRMQGSLNKMAPASRQWRQAADWARELAHLVDTMQAWLARQLSSTRLPFQKVRSPSSQRLQFISLLLQLQARAGTMHAGHVCCQICCQVSDRFNLLHKIL